MHPDLGKVLTVKLKHRGRNLQENEVVAIISSRVVDGIIKMTYASGWQSNKKEKANDDDVRDVDCLNYCVIRVGATHALTIRAILGNFSTLIMMKAQEGVGRMPRPQ